MCLQGIAKIRPTQEKKIKRKKIEKTTRNWLLCETLKINCRIVLVYFVIEQTNSHNNEINTIRFDCLPSFTEINKPRRQSKFNHAKCSSSKMCNKINRSEKFLDSHTHTHSHDIEQINFAIDKFVSPIICLSHTQVNVCFRANESKCSWCI